MAQIADVTAKLQSGVLQDRYALQPVTVTPVTPVTRKPSPETQKVLDWIQDHPNSDLSQREIAKLIGVSHMTVKRTMEKQ